MSGDEPRPPLNRQIVEEAAEWFVEINEGEADSTSRQRFHAWLTRSPEHVRAYLELLPMWQEGAQLDTFPDDPHALIEWARSGTNVVPLTGPTPTRASESDPMARSATGEQHRARSAAPRTRWLTFAVAGSAFVVVAALVVWMQLFRGIYDAGIGEQRVIALEDGSQIELNASSRLRVRFTEGQRLVDLMAGQALFRVAKDSARPFIVRSGDASVRAVGTQFDVYRKPAGTIVTVLEGSVAVSPARAGGHSEVAILTAGQQIVMTPSMIPEPRPADIELATAWTQQRLAFSRASLVEVAAEFNRYNKRQLVIRDNVLETFQISGNFPSADPGPLIRFLRAQPGIRVNERSDEVEITVDSTLPPQPER